MKKKERWGLTMDDTTVRRTGVLDFIKTIGNREYHILTPVIGGLAIQVDEHSITMPIAHLNEFAEWLGSISEKIPNELDRAHKFERGA